MEEGKYYHIYNRGINREPVFKADEDYHRFITKIWYYLYPAFEVYAYCLMNNHFHLLVRIRSSVQQEELFVRLKSENAYPLQAFHGLKYMKFKNYNPSLQVGHLLNSHTKYFNEKYDRTGDLFEGRFRRIEIDSELYLAHSICYIHRNPIHHKITDTYEQYQFSSYNLALKSASTLLEKENLLQIFGSSKNFISAHNEFKEKNEDVIFEG